MSSPSNPTLEEVRQTLSDVQGMIEQYQQQTGLRFGMVLVVTSGVVMSYLSTLSPTSLVLTLRLMADKVECDAPGEAVEPHRPH